MAFATSHNYNTALPCHNHAVIWQALSYQAAFRFFHPYSAGIVSSVKVETVVADDVAEPIIEKIVSEISSGSIGDGKIFVYNVEDAVRVRTGERGESAL